MVYMTKSSYLRCVHAVQNTNGLSQVGNMTPQADVTIEQANWPVVKLKSRKEVSDFKVLLSIDGGGLRGLIPGGGAYICSRLPRQNTAVLSSQHG